MTHKKLIFVIIGFVLSLMNSSPVSAQLGEVRGRLYDHKNNEGIPFANIIIDGKPSKGTTTDSAGNYILRKVDPGYIRLVVSVLGYEKKTTEDFLVTKSHPVFFDIAIDETSVNLQTVEVRPSLTEKKEDSPLSVQSLSIQEIEKSPGANRDISKVIQSLPGVAQTVSYRNDIVVRGGGPSENRFYLDGVEIPNLNHFATQGSSGGSVGIVNVDFIRQVDLYTSAFQARRGNTLSSVLEMTQIEGNKDKFGGRFTIGSSDIGLTLNGPIGSKSTLMFSVRRSYLQFLFGLLKLPFLPTYNDYQVKYKWNITAKDQLSFISIGSLDDSKLNTGIKNPDETQKYLLGYLPEYYQWSYTVGLVYRHFRQKGNDTWVLSRNMLNNESTKYSGNVEIADSLLLKLKSQEIENKFRYEGVTDAGSWKFTYGAGLEYAKYTNQTYQKLFLLDSVRILNYNSTLELWKYSAFGQISKNFFDERLQFSLGFRLDGNTYSNLMVNPLNQFSPRFSASYQFAKGWFMNFNAGRYYQLPAYTTLGFRDNGGRLVNDSLGIKYISCDHLVLGLEYQYRANAMISLEGFYKYYQNYPLSLYDSVSLASKGSDFGIVGDEPVTPSSKGRAYGFEVLFRDINLFKFNVIISYTFVRSEFTNYYGAYIPSAWDNRNLLNLTVSRKFKYNWQVGIKYRYAGGAPYTPWDYNKSSLVAAWNVQGRGYLDYAQYNTLRLKDFNQLDLRVDKAFYFKKWSLMVYLDIQNALNLQAQQPDLLINTQPDGSVKTYVDPQGNLRYVLRTIPNYAGTIVPAIGIMVDW
ncbi:MAG: TonB-dependent receptor [Bacteroidetes bacterium]|nr:TonB-dependent receptor [Bacteroidota bacterium]